MLTWILSPWMFLLAIIFPKDKKLWLFGAWFGERYGDNSKAFFEFVVTKNQGIKAYWVYKSKSLGDSLLQQNIPCVYAYSLRGIYLQLRAKVFISSINSTDFIPFFLSFRNFYVQLWHGSPIKKVGLDMREKGTLRYFVDRLRFSLFDKYTLVISPAETFDKLYSSAFNVPLKKVHRCGYPRNEYLKITDEIKASVKSKLEIGQNQKIVIYMPTHRNEGRMGTNDENGLRANILKILDLNQAFSQLNLTVVVKPHYYDKENLEGLPNKSNIKFVYETPVDLYQLLGASDALLTDYSSVVFDYELTGHPIILWPFDLEQYLAEDRKMYFDFKDIYKKLLNSWEVNSYEELPVLLGKDGFFKKECVKKSLFNTPMNDYSSNIYNKIISELKLGN